jgi:hypothetical protein
MTRIRIKRCTTERCKLVALCKIPPSPRNMRPSGHAHSSKLNVALQSGERCRRRGAKQTVPSPQRTGRDSRAASSQGLRRTCPFFTGIDFEHNLVSRDLIQQQVLARSAPGVSYVSPCFFDCGRSLQPANSFAVNAEDIKWKRHSLTPVVRFADVFTKDLFLGRGWGGGNRLDRLIDSATILWTTSNGTCSKRVRV